MLFFVPPNSVSATLLCRNYSKAEKSIKNTSKLSVLTCSCFAKRFLLSDLLHPKECYRKVVVPRRAAFTMTGKNEQQLSSSKEEDRISKKREEAERLRAAEKFIRKDEGKFGCPVCEYVYEPDKGDSLAGIQPGTSFEALPDTFRCPVCRSPKDSFVPRQTVIAGFATNQSYGLGSNAMTPGQKNALIFGGLFLLFLLLMAGYGLS